MLADQAMVQSSLLVEEISTIKQKQSDQKYNCVTPRFERKHALGDDGAEMGKAWLQLHGMLYLSLKQSDVGGVGKAYYL